MKVVKTILGVLSSPEIIRLFDKNNDGVVSWKEFTSASTSTKMHALAKIGGDLAMKYGWLLIGLL